MIKHNRWRNALAICMLALLGACGSPFPERSLTSEAELVRAREVAEDNGRRYMAGLEVAPEGGNLGMRIRRDPTTGFVSVQVIGRVTSMEGQINNGTYIFTSDESGRINTRNGPLAGLGSYGETMGATLTRGAFQVLAGAVNGVAAAGVMVNAPCSSCRNAGAGVVNIVEGSVAVANARTRQTTDVGVLSTVTVGGAQPPSSGGHPR
jgi:hypothetical protein